ncbi:MAG: ATP-binding cassette domain-containing protein [Treponema sp.]|jgi:peptide/nickel transport system ATP-binding protein/oligopeptide transport system ATP-binding protein|nr:ATP-binding cassette domain-containing protein [Treponema sp.]
MKDAGTSAVLEAHDVRTYFPIRGTFGRIVNQVKAVDGVSLSLYEGETYGLVGETGCGKSTLGRTLIRLLKPVSGSIILDGKDITNLPDKKLRPIRKQVQMVFQDPYTSLNPRKRVGDILIEALTIHKIGGQAERMYKTMGILDKVGLLPEHFYRFPHELSGGQRQRIGLARAFILNPKIIICDEPVSALDVSIQSQIINLLRQFQEQDNQTFLFIAHDINVIKYISRRIGVMYLGRIVEEAETDTLFRNPLHPYTRTLLSAVPRADPRHVKKRIILQGEPPSPINPPPGCPFHTRCPQLMPSCSEIEPALQGEADHKVACLRCG